MHPVSSNTGLFIQSVDDRIRKGGLTVEHGDDTTVDAIHLLYFQFQVDIRSNSFQIPVP